MKSKALVWFYFCFVAFRAAGDGCVIAPSAFAKVSIPDQRALIGFDNGTETLVIDNAFKGDGTNFAWIVPVPSVPKVDIATTGLFPTLQMVFRSKIIHNVPSVYWLAVGIWVFIFSILWARKRGESVLGLLLFWFFALLFSSMLLPALATAELAPSPRAGLDVVERKRVGIYDTAILSSRDGGALLGWLNTNGFATPTNFLPTIQAYARENWVFVASKIALEASRSEVTALAPLSLVFKTKRPVYPLRLTGIGNDACTIDLYVFGPGRAEVRDFSVE